MQDPIADMLTIIRNGQSACKDKVSMPASKLKLAIASVLKAEGYITDYRIESQEKPYDKLIVILKYFEGRAVIARIKRVSRPGLRVYRSCDDLGDVKGFGIEIVSTSKGILADWKARKLRVGGEVLCEVA